MPRCAKAFSTKESLKLYHSPWSSGSGAGDVTTSAFDPSGQWLEGLNICKDEVFLVCLEPQHCMCCVVPSADVAMMVHDSIQLKSRARAAGSTHELLQRLHSRLSSRARTHTHTHTHTLTLAHTMHSTASLQIQLWLEIHCAPQLDQRAIKPGKKQGCQKRVGACSSCGFLGSRQSRAMRRCWLPEAVQVLRTSAFPGRSVSDEQSAKEVETTRPVSCFGAGTLCTSGSTHCPQTSCSKTRQKIIS